MKTFATTALLVLAMAALLALAPLAAAKKSRTGSWGIPDRDDVRWLASRTRVIREEPTTPHIVVLDRSDLRVRGGRDDARHNRSGLVPTGSERVVPGFAGSERSWKAIQRCIESRFSDFNIEFRNDRPAGKPYILAHVGGDARNLVPGSKDVGGLAPFTGEVLSYPIVFIFSDALKNRRQAICEVVAHEIGHVYGLDHSFRCRDLMSYLSGCGRKTFLDRAVPCGEEKRRACASGAPQNSHRHLLGILGPRIKPEEVTP